MDAHRHRISAPIALPSHSTLDLSMAVNRVADLSFGYAQLVAVWKLHGKLRQLVSRLLTADERRLVSVLQAWCRRWFTVREFLCAAELV